jgi:hypothetical protein
LLAGKVGIHEKPLIVLLRLDKYSCYYYFSLITL